MCFSASASFGAGVILTTVGIASIKKAQSPGELFFASIPMIFAVQQTAEGFLWLSLQNPAYAALQQPMTYIFLFFAQVVWPVWVPYAIFKMETQEKYRQRQRILTIIGVMVASYLGYCLLTYPVKGSISEYHIAYTQDYPDNLSRYLGFLYIVATIAPCFVSGVKRMWSLGLPVLISYVITSIFYTYYVVSVWCFFASIISISVFYILYKLHHPGSAPSFSRAEAS